MTISRRIAATASATVLAAAAAAGVAVHALDAEAASLTSATVSPTTVSSTTVSGSTVENRGDDTAVALPKTQNQIGAVVDPTSTMQAYLSASHADVSQTWTRLFAGWGYQAPTARVVFPAPGQRVQSCGAASDDTTMQYCPTDDTITFSQQAATDMWTGRYNQLDVADNGGMSVTLLVAHEYGHNIEAELDHWGDNTVADQAGRERGADCFAGVWAQDAAERGLLDTTDVGAAYAALDLAAEHPEKNIADGVHGTPAQRQHAYEVGATRGAKGCVDTYLSTMTGGADFGGQQTQQVTTAPQTTGTERAELSQDPTQITLR